MALRWQELVATLVLGSAAACRPASPGQAGAPERASAPPAAAVEPPRFTDVSADAGVERPDPSLLERGGRGLLSHGAAAADVDGDGRLDVYATGATVHALFRNLGDGGFEDVAAAARVHATSHPACAPLFLDADADGDQDLFVTGLGGLTLFENRLIPEGRLEFRDVSMASGVQRVRAAAFSAAAGDVDADGRPDIVVACYGWYGDVIPDSWVSAANGEPDLLLLNRTEGAGLRFREAASERGCADPRWGYATLVADVDDDADLDVLVANDFGGAVGLFLNGGSRFRDVADERGLGAPSYGMGLSLGDVDRDGDLDLHVTKASSEEALRLLDETPGLQARTRELVGTLASGNSLLLGKGGGRFEAARQFATGWSWGGGFVDVDMDGWPDLHVPGGFLSGTGPDDTDDLFWRQVVDSLEPGGRSQAEFFAEQVPAILERGASFAGHERDSLLLADGRGGWTDVSAGSGLDSPTDGRAAVHADIDDDGDPDVFLRAMHGRAHLLFRNELAPAARFVRVALRGRRDLDACGATVRLLTVDEAGARRVTAQAKLCGSGFLAQSDPRLLFALPRGERAVSIEVTWPNGARQAFTGGLERASLLLREGEPEPVQVVEHPFRLGGGMIGP